MLGSWHDIPCSILGRPNYLLEKLHWEPEPFIICFTHHFLRSKALVLLVVLVLFFFVCFVFGLGWFCVFVWLGTLALLFKDRGFLNTVPIMVITLAATIVMMSAAWGQKETVRSPLTFSWRPRRGRLKNQPLVWSQERILSELLDTPCTSGFAQIPTVFVGLSLFWLRIYPKTSHLAFSRPRS